MAKNPESRFIIRAIDRTQAVFARIRAGLGTISRQVRLFGTIGAFAIAAFAAKGIQAADSLAKMSDQSQVATESIQAYRLALELAGGSSQGLDKAIVMMNKNIGQSIRDGGSYERIFASIGLQSAKLAEMGTDKAFEAIGDAIAKLPTAAQRSAAAMQIFGRSARDMLVLFKDGTGGIDAARKDIDELGISMSRVDTAKVEIANDQLTRMKALGIGASQVFAMQLAPVIMGLSESFLNSAKNAGGLSSVMEKIVTFGAKGFAQVGNVMRGWELIIKGARVAFAGFGEFSLSVVAEISRAYELFVGKAIFKTNELIIGLNRASQGVIDMDIIVFRGFELDDSLAAAAKTFGDAKKELQADFLAVASEPLPTEKLDIWLATWKEKIQAAAVEIAETSEARLIPEVSSEELEGEKERLDKIIAARQENLQSSRSISGELLKISEQTAGKQSGIYKTMFAASKAFAISEAIVKIQQGIAGAAAVPFPANLAAIATVASATAGIVSTIQGATMSFEGGGYTGAGARAGGMDGKGGFMAMVHPRERIIDEHKGQGGGQSIIQNITINGRLTEAEKRETAANGAEMALSMLEERTYRNPNLRRNF